MSGSSSPILEEPKKQGPSNPAEGLDAKNANSPNIRQKTTSTANEPCSLSYAPKDAWLARNGTSSPGKGRKERLANSPDLNRSPGTQTFQPPPPAYAFLCELPLEVRERIYSYVFPHTLHVKRYPGHGIGVGPCIQTRDEDIPLWLHLKCQNSGLMKVLFNHRLTRHMWLEFSESQRALLMTCRQV